MTTSLELEEVRAFLLVAELGSFTLAAETMMTTQSAVSLRLKRLERAVGHRLIERTPRHVRPSAQGSAFLQPARDLLRAHDRAAAVFRQGRQRLAVGVSDHVAGPELPALVAELNRRDPELVLDVRIGSSGDLLQAFDRRELDVVITRFQTDRPEGEVLAEEKYGWYAAPGWQHSTDEPLPVAIMPEPCGIRVMALQMLDRAGIPWRETFAGGGVAAVAAAVSAGLGISPLARRMLPSEVVDVGQRLGLPELPSLPIVLHSRSSNERAVLAVSRLGNAFRDLASSDAAGHSPEEHAPAEELPGKNQRRSDLRQRLTQLD